MLELDNVIYFDTDDDFYSYAVNPIITVVNDPNHSPYYDMDFTDTYKIAVKNGKMFCIKDENSTVYKHKCVSCNTLSKTVDNLKQYLGTFTDKKIAKKIKELEETNENN